MNFQSQKIVCIALIYLLSANVRCGCAELSVEALSPEENEEVLNDVTRGLTDDEIDLALSDLNFNEMNALSQLVDSTDLDDDIDDDDSFINSNARSPSFMPQALNSMLAQMAAQGNIDNNALDDTQNMNINENYNRPPTHMGTNRDSYEENEREKREDAQGESPFETQQVVDEEYIRQLENSFPRDQDQTEIDDPEGKKEHIRVKRKEDLNQFCPVYT